MIETIDYDMYRYPAFQAEGNAAKFIMPFALEVCKGVGYDIGCNRMNWCMPTSDERYVMPIDPKMNDYSAMNLPKNESESRVDFIFSSHCLEHIRDPWYDVLEYWKSNIKHKGVMFLYLPDYSQRYWRPWNNRNHVHILTREILSDAFHALGMTNVFVSGVDLMNSFAIMGEVNHEE